MLLSKTRLPFLVFLIFVTGWVASCSINCATAQDAEKKRQWILATTATLRTAAKPLIEKRQEQGWKVIVIDTDKHAKKADLDEAIRLHCEGFSGESCVLLLGTWEQKETETHVAALRGTHGRMVDLPTDHGFGLPEEDESVTIAVGRLPAREVSEAKAIIKKILAFESAQFESNRVNLLVAHPGGESDFEEAVACNVVKTAVKLRLKELSARWQPDCVMDIPRSDHSVEPEAFSSEIQRAFSEGYLFTVFSGHSYAPAIVSQAGEVFQREDFEKLEPKAPGGIFISCGCYGCQISGMHGQGYGISAIRSANGPVAVIGATGESYSVQGLLAFDGLLSQMKTEQPPQTLGAYWLAIQHGITRGKVTSAEFMMHDMADGSGGTVPLDKQRLEHAEMWVLLGDPAMSIPFAVK